MPSSPRCGRRWRCSTASSPTPSRSASPSSRSRGAARARSATATEAPIEMAMTASAGGRELSQRLAKIETAISRRKTIQFSYYTMERDATMDRKVDPYHLVFRSGQFYLIGYAHERDAVRVFRLSRIQGKVSYASKAEHDFNPPGSFDRRDYASRADWQMGYDGGDRADLPPRPDRLAGRARLRRVRRRSSRRRNGDGKRGKGSVFETDFSSSRQLVAWLLGWRQNAAVLDPPELAVEAEERRELLRARHSSDFETAKPVASAGRRRGRAPRPLQRQGRDGDPARALRAARDPRRHADRLGPQRAPPAHRRRLRASSGSRSRSSPATSTSSTSSTSVAAPTSSTPRSSATRSRSTPRPTATASPSRRGCCRSRPRRWSPRSTSSATTCPRPASTPPARRSSQRSATTPPRRGCRSRSSATSPRSSAPSTMRSPSKSVLKINYYKENEDQFTSREIEPYRLARGPDGWYVGCRDRKRDAVRHFRLDRTKEAEPTGEHFEPLAGRGRPALRAGVAERRRGHRRPRRPRLGLARAGPLGPRGAHGRRGARRRRPDHRDAFRRHVVARPRGARRAPATWSSSSPTTRAKPSSRPSPRRSERAAGVEEPAVEAPGHPAVVRVRADNPGR